MTSRERLAPGKGIVAARQADGPEAPSPAGPGSGADKPRAPRWEEVYRSASAEEQAQLLALAQRQGVVYAHQLPSSRNGAAPSATPDALESVLRRLLNGQTEELEPVRAAAVSLRDNALDNAQREAVARVLATPDLCLLRGLPGTGKSRTAAEIIIQAAAQGQRVLLAGFSPAAIDRVLEQISSRAEICALRCLSPEENLETLPPACQTLTNNERFRQLSEQAATDSRQRLAACEQRLSRLRRDEPAWDRLAEVVERLEQLTNHLNALTQRRAGIGAEVEQEAIAAETAAPESLNTTFGAELAPLARGFQETQAKIGQALLLGREQQEVQQRDQAELKIRLEALRPLTEAKHGWHVWTGMWWRAAFRKNLHQEWQDLESKRQQVEASLTDSAGAIEGLEKERDQAAAAYQAERGRRLDLEVVRRQTELDHQLAAASQEQELLHGKWQNACRALDPAGPRPQEPTRASASEARSVWRQQLLVEDQERTFLVNWLACLDEPDWPGRWRAYANVVAVTLSALAADEHFGSQAPAGMGFDLLVLQEAERITETELLQAARRARRVVLIGETPREDGRAPGHGAGLRKSRVPTLRAEVFEKLWQLLHWEPRSLPYAWVQEEDHLSCRLRPVSPEQRQWLETERLADFPDIELRILALPRTQPQLAEVVFPPALSIAEAKAYLFKELEELTVQTSGHSACWIEEPERLVFRLAEELIPDTVAVELEAGVRELVSCPIPESDGQPGTLTWRTGCLEFDRQAGWDRSRAEEWIQRHLGVRDLGRTVRLDVPHRMDPDLAAFLSHLLYEGEYRVAEGTARLDAQVVVNGRSAHVQFVPVPPLRERQDQPKSKDPPALPRSKGGAGLEVDLADPRQRSKLPGDLAVHLPNRGMVNYLEAQAVLRTLQTMGADPDSWLGPERAAGAGRPLVAVIGLYSAQVELIRRLMGRIEDLTQGHFDVVIDVPAAFRERECPVVLLSLTRSHSHRAVSFGDGPDMLALALTRARSRLVLFGDPGALARRSQWEGPLDHLDETSAARERDWIAHLVQYLQGRGSHPRAFHLHEGVGT